MGIKKAAHRQLSYIIQTRLVVAFTFSVQVTMTAAILVVTGTCISTIARFSTSSFLVAARFAFAGTFLFAFTSALTFVLRIVSIRAVDVAVMTPGSMMLRAAAIVFLTATMCTSSK